MSIPPIMNPMESPLKSIFTSLTVLLAATLSLAVASNANADTYPSKGVRIINPFPPAGSSDAIARILADRLSKKMGQQFTIENRPGAGGNLGADYVAKAPPDGYTLLMGAAGAMAINVSLYAKMPYDPARDFAPITLVGYVPVVVIASANAPANSIRELISAAKANPEKISFASNGNGTAHHLAGELFMQSTKTKMTVVQYKSTQAAMQDVVGERIQYGFLDLTAALPLLSSGRVKGLATTGPTRSSAAPHIPTVGESGLAGYEVVGWFGLFAPKGTPASIVATLNDEVRSILAEPEVRSRAAQLAIEVKASSPAELLKYQVSEIDRWAGLINAANIKLD